MDIFEGKKVEDLTEKDINKIFTANIDDLVEMCYPNYEGQFKLFEFFGTRTGGISDGWVFTKNWKELPEELKWRYVALCSLYWSLKHKKAWWEQYQELCNLRIELEMMKRNKI